MWNIDVPLDSLPVIDTVNGPNEDSGHYLNFLRQVIPCNSDISSIHFLTTPMERAQTVCDWMQIYAGAVENQKGPMRAEQNRRRVANINFYYFGDPSRLDLSKLQTPILELTSLLS
jgi:hypothetical protein